MSNASRTRTSQDTAGTQESRAKALQSAITAMNVAPLWGEHGSAAASTVF